MIQNNYFKRLTNNLFFKRLLSSGSFQFINNNVDNKISEFDMMIKQLCQNKQYYIRPLYFTKTHHYTSYLFRTINLSNLNNQDKNIYFRQIKKSFKLSLNIQENRTIKKMLAPESATSLIQDLSFYEFQGDQDVIIGQIIKYTQNNQIYFSEQQIQRFNYAYKKIMAMKAVGPVKFHQFKLVKKYHSQYKRKLKILDKMFCQQLNIPLNRKFLQINYDQNQQNRNNGKWINIQLPQRKISLLTIPEQNNLIKTQDQVYSYLFQFKSLIEKAINKIKKSNIQSQIKVFFIQKIKNKNISNQVQTKQQFIQDKSVIYRVKSKEKSQDGIKIKDLRKYSLKEQIQKMKIKKKQLKNKINQNNSSSTLNKNIDNKQIDLIKTLKLHIQNLKLFTFKQSNQYKNLLKINISHFTLSKQQEKQYLKQANSQISINKLKDLYAYLKLIQFHQKYWKLHQKQYKKQFQRTLQKCNNYSSLIDLNCQQQTQIDTKYKKLRNIIDQSSQLQNESQRNNKIYPNHIILVIPQEFLLKICTYLPNLKYEQLIKLTKNKNQYLVTDEQTNKIRQQLVQKIFNQKL